MMVRNVQYTDMQWKWLKHPHRWDNVTWEHAATSPGRTFPNLRGRARGTHANGKLIGSSSPSGTPNCLNWYTESCISSSCMPHTWPNVLVALSLFTWRKCSWKSISAAGSYCLLCGNVLWKGCTIHSFPSLSSSSSPPSSLSSSSMSPYHHWGYTNARCPKY